MFNGFAQIIEQAGKGQLAFASFLVLMLATLAWRFFGKDARWIRIGAFLAVVACVVFLVFLLAIPAKEPSAPNHTDDHALTKTRIAAVLDARRAALEGVRFQVSHDQSCTKGSSGGSKRATLSAQCPAFAIRDGDAELLKQSGGCYGPGYSAQGATGTVSQTGVGRSSCRLVVSCKLTSGTIATRVASDEVALSNATDSNLDLLMKTLPSIEYPHVAAPGVNCY